MKIQVTVDLDVDLTTALKLCRPNRSGNPAVTAVNTIGAAVVAKILAATPGAVLVSVNEDETPSVDEWLAAQVHECKADEASAINNDSCESQIFYLLESGCNVDDLAIAASPPKPPPVTDAQTHDIGVALAGDAKPAKKAPTVEELIAEGDDD